MAYLLGVFMRNSSGQKILTIAIPAYNIEDYIDRAVSNIVACRALPAIDVIVVNDGSTDTTADKAKAYAEKYPESVRVINKCNGHYGSAVNTAINEARGIYFKILDGDDEYYSDGLDDLLSFLNSSGTADMVLTDYEIVYEETGNSHLFRQQLTPCVTMSFDDSNLQPCAMHSIAFKTSVLKSMRVRLDEGVSFTDVEFVLYPMGGVSSVSYCDSLVYSYKIGREGQSVDLACIDKNMPSHELVLLHCVDWLERNLTHLTSAKRAYASKRIARMLDDHVHRCLLSEEPKSWLPGLKTIVSRCDRCQSVMNYSSSKALKLLRASGYFTYMPLNALMRRKVGQMS